MEGSREEGEDVREVGMQGIKEMGEVAGSLLGTWGRWAGAGQGGEGRGGHSSNPGTEALCQVDEGLRGLSCRQVHASPRGM